MINDIIQSYQRSYGQFAELQDMFCLNNMDKIIEF